MNPKQRVYRTTVEIYTLYNPDGEVELEELVREATSGDAIAESRTEELDFDDDSVPDGVRSFFEDPQLLEDIEEDDDAAEA